MWQRLRENPMMRDRLLAGIFLAVGLLLLAAGGYPLWRQVQWVAEPALHLAGLLVACVGVPWRSRRPLLALGLIVAGALIDGAGGGSLGVVLVLADGVYAAARYTTRPGSRWLFKLGVGCGVVTGIMLIIARAPAQYWVWFLQLLSLVVISAWWGASVRNEARHTEQIEQLRHHAKTAAMRQELAHELHDLVSNRLATIGLHTEALKLNLPADAGEQVTSSLRVISETTTLAQTDLRSLLQALTADSAAPRVQAADWELARLQDHLPGRTVEFAPGSQQVIGQLAAELAPWQFATVQRILAELVHNSAKHGLGVTQLSVAYAAGEYVLACKNAIRVEGSAGVTHAPGGLGLEAAAAAARSIGGTLGAAQENGMWIATLRIAMVQIAGEGEAHG